MKEPWTFPKIITENIQFTYSEAAKCSEEYILHCHNYYEIYYFLEGSVDYLVEGHKYRPEPGSILLLSLNAFHGFRVRQEGLYRRIALHFTPKVLPLEHRALLLSIFPEVSQEPRQNIYFTNVRLF
ncbi:MAG: hypothetical protein E7293_11335 [Lachnospiraceae bacterium]|nr:hypothetical protein [Lachnospiraceae bacterium]